MSRTSQAPSPDRPTFRKHDARPRSTELEALGLLWLAEAMEDGGAHVVPVTTGRGWLEEPRLRTCACTPEAAEALGRALAVTHAAGAREHGAAPDGWDRPAGWMGAADLPLRPRTPRAQTTGSGTEQPGPAPRRWGEFYAEDRLLPYLPAAVRNGSMTTEGAAVVERVASRLTDGEHDSPQPRLLALRAGQDGLPEDAGRLAARTHGDLWAGNVLWVPRPEVEDWAPTAAGTGPLGTRTAPAGGTGTGEGGRCGGGARGAMRTGAGDGTHDGEGRGGEVVGVLIDPAAQGGHAETDLAELAVFGQRHLGRLLAAYDEVSPLAGGWRERTGLHQLHMLLVHAALFGGGYGTETVATARRYA